MATKKILTDLVSTGKVVSTGFIKTGGTSSQFLKADGTVDSTVYGTGSGTVDGSGTVRYVPMWKTGGIGLEDSIARFNAGGTALGIGKDPSFTLDVEGSANIEGNLFTRTQLAYFNMDQLEDARLRLHGHTSGELDIVVTTDTASLEYGDSSIVLHDGNVGIGTDSPDVKLEVESATSASGIRIKNTNSGFASLDIESNRATGSNLGGLRYKKTGQSFSQAEINYVADTRLDIALGDGTSGPTKRLSILEGGNVGIGTSSPAQKLTIGDIGTNNTDGLKIEDPSNTAYGAHYSYNDASSTVEIGGVTNNVLNDCISIARDATRAITINTSENVGIGTDSPRTKLHVSGLTGDDDPALGSSTAPLFISNTSNSFGLNVGVNNAGASWLQAQSNTSSTAYEMSLNPLGGNVGVGLINPAYKLDVNGTGRFTETLKVDEFIQIQGAGTTANETIGIGLNITDDFSYVGNDSTTRYLNHYGMGIHKPLQSSISGGNGAYLSGYFGVDIFTSGNSRIHVNQTGNVGIGTTDPNTKLQVSSSDAQNTIRLENTDTTIISAQEPNAIEFYTNDSSTLGTGVTGKISQVAENAGNLYGIAFNTYNTVSELNETMRIDSSGNVGIGTDSPNAKLEVAGSARITGGLDVGYGSNGTNFVQVGLGRTTNGFALIDLIGDATYADYGFRILRNNNGPNADTDLLHRGTGDLDFKTVDAGDIGFHTTSIQRMIVKADGDVGIGDSTPSYKLDVNGDIRATGSITENSDASLKENIRTIEDACDKISQLRGVEYNKIGEDKNKIGLIAQEVESVLPDVITEDLNGIKSIYYTNLIGLLIQSNKELIERVNKLEDNK